MGISPRASSQKISPVPCQDNHTFSQTAAPPQDRLKQLAKRGDKPWKIADPDFLILGVVPKTRGESKGKGHSMPDFTATWCPCEVSIALQFPDLKNLRAFLGAESRYHATLLAVNRQDKKVRIVDSNVNIHWNDFPLGHGAPVQC